MAYLVTNQRSRREFESIKQANVFRKELGLGAFVYEIDNFGNAIKLSENDIFRRINSEAEVQQMQEESERITRKVTTFEKQDTNNIANREKQGVEAKEEFGEERKSRKFFKYSLIAIMIIVVAIVVIFMILPLLKEFLQTFEAV